MVLGVVTSGMALAHAPHAIANPVPTLPNLLTAAWALGAAFLVARIASIAESKLRARFAPAAKPQSKSHRKAPPKRAVQNEEKWLAHLRRTADTVRISNKPAKPSKVHGIHRPLDIDDDISHVGTGRPAYVGEAA